MELSIPIYYKPGTFKLNEINPSESVSPVIDPDDELAVHIRDVVLGELDTFELEYDEEYGNLSYDEPRSRDTVTIYFVSEDSLKNELTVVYDGIGRLEKIELVGKELTELVYIRLDNMHYADRCVYEFVKKQCKKLAKAIKKRGEESGEPFARIFIESFYDGDSIDVSVKTATVKEVRAVIDKYNDTESADYSGNFPMESRIEPDLKTLRVMLLCAPEDYRDELFFLTTVNVKKYIEKHVLDSIEKTEDFKFICQEYD